MNATQIMEPLATDTKRRNWVVGISTLGAIAGHVVNMYQNKVIENPAKSSVLGAIADQADDTLHKNGVDMPDAVINVINFALTAWLARAGGKKRAKNQPILPIAMGVKTVADAAVAMEVARKDWDHNKQVGTYPQIAAIVALSAAAVAVPEMVKGIRQLLARD